MSKIMRNGVEFTGGASAWSGTQAEYDALPIKDSTTLYFITDADGSGHNYSTDEQVVGTWIDGSTLYEKTVSLGSFTIQANNNVSFTLSNYISDIDKVISFNGCAETWDGYNSGYIVLPFEGYWSGTEWSVLIACSESSIVITRVGESGSYTLNNCYVTLRYTKSSS